jgi:hypothetical protein
VPKPVNHKLVLPHLLERGDREVSAPVLGYLVNDGPETNDMEHELPRSDEIENIPETVDEEEEDICFTAHHHQHHTPHHNIG